MSYENFNKKNMKTGAMKRFGFMMVCVWLTCLGATAQTYRGFVDAAMIFDVPKVLSGIITEKGRACLIIRMLLQFWRFQQLMVCR